VKCEVSIPSALSFRLMWACEPPFTGMPNCRRTSAMLRHRAATSFSNSGVYFMYVMMGTYRLGPTIMALDLAPAVTS